MRPSPTAQMSLTPELKDFKAWENNLDVYFVYKRL